MDTLAELNPSTAIAANVPTKAAAVQVKLAPDGYYIDHPDPELAEQLMADALGVSDRDAMNGILRQLVEASMSGPKPDPVNLSFMLAMIKSIRPRDGVEAMLVAQMVSVHVTAMRCAHLVASLKDIAAQDSAGRALSRLTRAFPAQVEALNRYRNSRGPAISVHNVSVQDGGQAIVGSITQRTNVIVSHQDDATPATDRRMTEIPDRGAQPHDAVATGLEVPA